MNIGRNTAAGQALQSYVERIESIRADKKALGEHEAAILAAAKAQGFVPTLIKHVVKVRAMNPQDRQEAEAIVDVYLHSLGMTAETPLFRQVGLMNVDTAQRDEVIEALKKFVPDNGSITVEAGGRPVRLTRDSKGEVTVKDVVDPPPTPAATAPATAPVRPAPPDVDMDTAEQLGRAAFDANKPIITNPFPFGDGRRPRWDAGWRKASGTDGMGPDDGGD